MSFSGFIAYSGALAIAAIIPGPQIVAIIAQALRTGYRQAAWMAAGMVLGDVLYLAAVLGGHAFIAETFSFSSDRHQVGRCCLSLLAGGAILELR